MKKKIKIIIVLLVVAAICITDFKMRSAYYERKRVARVNEPYMSINDKQITTSEYKYAYSLCMNEFLSKYGNKLKEIGLDTSRPFGEQIQDEKSGKTWEDFFNTMAQQKIVEINFMYDKSVEENYRYENLDSSIDSIIKNMERNAESDNTSLDDYLAESFVRGIKTEELKPILEKYETAENYISSYKDGMDITNEEIEEKYNNNKSSYDLVTYRVYTMPISDEYQKLLKEAGKDASRLSGNEVIVTNSEEFKEAKKKTRKTADEFYKQVYDEETYKELCIKYSEENSAKKKLYEESDYSLHIQENSDTISNVLSEWLYDEARTEKATAVIYDKDNLCYYIVYFINRQKNDGNTVTIKNIFLPFVSTDLNTYRFSEADKKKVQDQADQIVSEYNNSGRTEKDFDRLIEKYNKNLYNTGGNGVYTVSSKNDLPYTIRDWCYEEGRKAGDINMVSDDSGCYITYFAQNAQTGYDEKVRNDVELDKYHKYLNEKLNECKIKTYK